MPLTGFQFQQLHQALLSAFPTHTALAQMVQFGLNQNLDIIVGPGNLADVAFQLISWTEAKGQTEELVTKARGANPGNSDLKAFAKAFSDQNNNLSNPSPIAYTSSRMTASPSFPVASLSSGIRDLVRLVNRILDLMERRDLDPRTEIEEAVGNLFTFSSQSANDLSAAANAILEGSNAAIVQQRNDLIALQKLLTSIIDADDLSREISNWQWGVAWKEQSPSFRDAAIKAIAGLALIPPTLLNAMTRRHVAIHPIWRSGFHRHMMSDLAVESSIWASMDDRYAAENAQRVMTSLQAILAADAQEIFPDPPEGTRLASHTDAKHLLVAYFNRLELRRVSNPIEVAAVLPLSQSLTLQHATIVRFGDGVAVCGADAESTFIWDPRRSEKVLARFSVEKPLGISGIAHFGTDSQGVRSIVTTKDGPIYELHNFSLVKSWTPVRSGYLTHPVVLNDCKNMFALSENRFPVVRVNLDHPEDDGLPFIDKTWVSNALRGRPDVLARINWRLTLDSEFTRGGPDDKRVSWDQLNFDASAMKEFNIDGEPLLAITIHFWFFTAMASLLLFLSPSPAEVNIVGHFYREDAMIADYSCAPGPDGRLRLHYCTINDYPLFDHSRHKQPQDRIGSARATPTTGGIIFVNEGTSLRTNADVEKITSLNYEQGFASDNHGKLYSFSNLMREYVEIEEGSTSHIAGLSIISWR